MAWEELVRALRDGPPWLLRPADPAINTIELFVHHEDLRRAQPGWETRDLAAADDEVLWRQLRFFARFARYPGVARLESPPLGPIILSPRTPVAGREVVTGPVGELVLWANRRTSVARVDRRPLI